MGSDQHLDPGDLQAELEVVRAENQLLQSIVESSSQVLSQTHYRAGMTKALAIVGVTLGIDRAYMCEYRPASTADQEQFALNFAWAREGYSLEPVSWQQLAKQLQTLSSYPALMDNLPFAGIARLQPQADQALFREAKICSMLWLPIQVDHHFGGFIGLEDCQVERQWPPRSIQLLQTWSTLIGGALEHHQSEERLVYGAFHDSLTGLPNRALFLNRLRQALQRSQRQPSAIFAVLFLDLDGFKSVNDTLGHQVGDQLLIAIAKRLANCLRPGDTLSRLGGDEFVVLLNDLHGIGDATSTAQRLRFQVSRPFQLDENEVFTDVSMGITLSSYGYTTVEQILGDADQAMYEAKTSGKGRYRLFKRESSEPKP
ncbi:MAG: diguanylate cyclase [Thermosynechococcaceae cyanobacterium]